MESMSQVPRSRGAVSGVLLILLGLWGGLAPFIGSYLKFGYTPDKAWAWTSGRLWLSVAPGAAALLGGLLVLAASNRTAGGIGAFLAALGGAWFVLGAPIIAVAVKSHSISQGRPFGGTLGSLSVATKQTLEQAGLFTGVGVLIVFFGALALGRFAVVGVRDVELAEAQDSLTAGDPEATAMDHDMGYPATTTGQFPVSENPFPRSAGPGQLRGPGS
jgi:hypothetical protein